MAGQNRARWLRQRPRARLIPEVFGLRGGVLRFAALLLSRLRVSIKDISEICVLSWEMHSEALAT